mmetsp:Transcript_7100/g.12179  ORF Transcript_7100/g.12179 Transcript_7100/m.12179 type:complete len:210 (-) Transcript_7100:1077-1706(-)|eukprot:CAMPEP_0119102416 /NCGR_PEP_ID=MMETSP1180-20130426/1175_1 /TAXON_ID=3052 ORGANISM="Chlamydomonas cf sp, Strain CCMP681" /NCGR_SAMPLE_ID=MMETSP1180 /ASSEMBLY_ACC=CAM_ASM_000741 /LENGTH=209 /DNA_ID=CAMNT_0007086709 /DNA_START=81 /DNA_END=710 /DNA_ORIENTATION=+
MVRAPPARPPKLVPGEHYLGGTRAQVLGRILICSVFMGAAVVKWQSFDKETGGPFAAWMAPRLEHFLTELSDTLGFTVTIDKSLYPRILIGSATLEFAGALLMLSNIPFGAQVLVPYMAIMTWVMHPFWKFAHHMPSYENERQHFVKNIAILGALIYFLASTKGTSHLNKYESMIEEAREKKRTDALALERSKAEALPAASPARVKTEQ